MLSCVDLRVRLFCHPLREISRVIHINGTYDHAGLMAATGFSAFGICFLSLLAILIKHGYPYVVFYVPAGDIG